MGDNFCYICLAIGITKNMDRLELCTDCFKRVEESMLKTVLEVD